MFKVKVTLQLYSFLSSHVSTQSEKIVLPKVFFILVFSSSTQEKGKHRIDPSLFKKNYCLPFFLNPKCGPRRGIEFLIERKTVKATIEKLNSH